MQVNSLFVDVGSVLSLLLCTGRRAAEDEGVLQGRGPGLRTDALAAAAAAEALPVPKKRLGYCEQERSEQTGRGRVS